MKTLFKVISFVLISINCLAQTSPVRTQLNNVFANINKSLVPTGFLQEYGEPLLPIDVFNGALSDSNKVDVSAWYVTYATLSSSRIYGTNPLADVATVKTIVANDETANAGSFVVPMLFADYNYLRPDAITAHLLSASNNQLFDVAGRQQSPYYARKLFVATPTLGYAATGTPAFIFKQDIFYNASTRTLSTIAIDFGDGRGYLPATWNTPIAGAYTATGTYQLKIKITFTDNTVMECYSPFRITQVAPQNIAARYPLGTALSQPITSPIGAHSGGTVYYILSTNNTSGKIKKPLIIAEGYDIYKIAPLLTLGNYSIGDFLSALDKAAPYDFKGQLDNIGSYDLVFLDYNNGTDDIVRNAALLQDVIGWVNGQKSQAGSIEQNVVLGQSMGGLVARYCLAKMTKQNLAHQTRLLITHDSPHQGANTPLGLQALVRAFSEVSIVQVATHLYGFVDLIPQLAQSISVLDAPASQQMLLLTATNGTGGYATNTWLNSTYRSMITFPAGGPQPAYQTIATSLGSECGLGSLTPGTNLFHAGGRFHISPVPWIVRTSYNANVNVNALPNYGPSQSIMNLHLWASIRILLVINIDVDLTNKSASSPSNTLPWDGAPGGTENIKDIIGDTISPSSNSYTLGPFIALFSSVSYAGDFCFVPTVSALDITTLNSSALSAAYVGGVSPTNLSRTSNFIAQEKFPNGSENYFNQSHIRFTPRNAQWLYDRMQNISDGLNCSTDCTTSYAGLLTGTSLLCGSGNYLINNFPASNTVTWSSSNPNGLQITGGQGTSTATFTRQNNFNGSATISATVSGSCGSVSVPPLSVWVGSPSLYSMSIDGGSGPYPLCSSGDNITYTANTSHEVSASVSGTSSINFTLGGSNIAGVVSGGPLSPTSYEFTSKSTAAKFTVTADASNACGTTSQCLYFSNSGPCTLPAITSVTVNGTPWSGNCGNDYIPYSANVWYTIVVHDNTNTPIVFSANHSGVITQTLSANSIRIKMNSTSLAFSVSAQTSNSCGFASTCIWFSNSGSAPYIVARPVDLTTYPNPATSTLTVQVSDSLSDGNDLAQPYQLNLINRYSQTVYTIQSVRNSIDIPIDALPPDVYYLNVFYKGAVLRKQIVIKR